MSARRAAIVGGGVIGGGWAARFVLNGWQVSLFDPGTGAEAAVREVIANARRSLPGVYDRALPPEGDLRACARLEEAVSDAQWVQESVPERLDLKRSTLAEIGRHAPADAVIASSTSGFTPSALQAGLPRPGRILVCHPFNPVYLLPLVEVVPSPATEPAAIRQAEETLRSLGMKPLVLRREIDAHVADRLLEAAWREALWLVRDGVASTAEIDDAIRYGFGLRWAQMGLFETYRLAGGDAGMRHFMAQFGPALAWPWSRLTDVPELDEALVERIAAQSDAQSGHLAHRELERIRDDNLVAILRALRGTGHGAGATVAAHEATLPQAATGELPVTAQRAVPATWVDYNGHMNESRYLEAFSAATDRFLAMLGAGEDYVASGLSFFTVESHLRHLGEVSAGERISVTTQVLAGAGRKLHLFHRMQAADGSLAATGEHLLLHVDLRTRRSCDPAPAVAARLSAIAGEHATLSVPEGAGRAVGDRRD